MNSKEYLDMKLAELNKEFSDKLQKEGYLSTRDVEQRINEFIEDELLNVGPNPIIREDWDRIE